MYIKTFYCNPFRECMYIVTAQEPAKESTEKSAQEAAQDSAEEQAQESAEEASAGLQPCIIIDPGMYGEKEEKRVSDYLSEHRLTVAAIFITHTHLDHICGEDFIKEHFPNVPVYGYNYHFEAEDTVIEVAGLHFRMLFTPGHKEDSVCYYFEQEHLIFTGDTLFQESIGRTDMPGGDYDVLQTSLKRLMQLPAETIVYPGHGYTTTIDHERRYNPFLNR